ncbi:MAG: Gfo/Idh/MocA family oxidoreductase [Planctomycetaceae bacterium]|jgi:predicted dehydrogenase|nr:Gfo/Idh/MocA family oxidoreductase [Planctomycetaceae bacterium]
MKRRDFLKVAAVLSAGQALTANTPKVHAAESNLIQIALVGAGGRGRGAAAQALYADDNTKLVAVADAFPDRTKNSTAALVQQFEKQTGRVVVPPEKQFSGLNAYKQAIDTLNKGDVAIFASPCGFRPLHVEYAVKKGINVFMEKPFAVDSPGTRRIQAAAKLADETGVKIACGLMWRHSKAREEVIKRIHGGEIGQLIHLRGFRLHDGLVKGGTKPADMTEVEFQIKNFHCFDWAGANLFIDYCIHNIDVACWAKGSWPVSCIALGGRSEPNLKGESYDTYYHEFQFADGTHLTSHGRYRMNCFNMYSDFAHGTKGSAVLMESLSKAGTKLFKDQTMSKESQIWADDGKEPNPYQYEHDLFFDAVRNNKPYNEGHRAAEANFASLLGRAAQNSGQRVTWEQIVNSDVVLCPNLETLAMDGEAPVKPNTDGNYPYAVPGETKNVF